MPMIEAHILEGYAPKDKTRLCAALTDAVRLVVPAAEEAITVMLHEYPRENYARGGRHRDPAPARPDPVALVLAYLQAMEARALDRAEGFLAEGFEMRFPGTGPMLGLGELVAWSRLRYSEIGKTIDGTEAFQQGDATVVYVRGTLAGVWTDGAPFAGIRFIDRFEVVDGRLIRQDVWNDLAEARKP